METAELYRAMHKALHSEVETVEVQGKSYRVERTNRRIRYIRYDDVVFAQQDPTQKTRLALMARRQPISRIIRTGRKWGWISDSEIADPLLTK